jgi:hypothetical protein
MSARSRVLLSLAVLTFAASATAVTAADDPCAGFKWNVTAERAVFSQKPHTAAAGRDATSAPAIKPQTLYELSLSPQDGVKFAVLPDKKRLPDGAFAGLAHFRVTTPGAYRVSLDQASWVDIVSRQQVLKSTDFTGVHDCSAPRKIVQYNLTPEEDLVLQFSAATKDRIRVALTPVAAAPAQ